MDNDHANVAVLPPTAAGKLACRHHWVIGPSDGPVSAGVCKFCHETREFKNSIGTSESVERSPYKWDRECMSVMGWSWTLPRNHRLRQEERH